MKTGDIKENYRGLFKEMGLQNFEKFLPAIQEAYQQGHDTRAELTEIINKIPGVKDNAKTRADNDTELQTKKAIEQFTVDIGKLGISLEKEFLPEIIDVIHSLDKFVNEDMEGIKTSIKVIGDVLLTIAEFMVVKKVAEGILGFIGAVNSIWKGLEKLVGIETAETIEKEKSTAALELLAAAATEAAERLALINPGIGGAATSTAATVGEEEVAGSIVLNGSKIGSMSMVAAALVVTMSVTKSIIDGIKDYGTRGTGHLGGDTFKYLAKDDRIRKIEELNANMPNNIKMNALNSAINKEYPNQMTQLLKTVGSRTDLIPELFKTSKEDSESSHFYEAGTDRGADQYGYYLGKQIKKLTDEIKTKDGKAHTGDKSSKGTASGTNVRGVQPKNTYITINDGLIKSFAPVLNGLNTNEDKLEALSDKMVSLIKNSMIQAINDSENISNSGS